MRGTLENPHVHGVLRGEGVSLLVTFRGTPPPSLEEAFDRILRVEQAAGVPWTESYVRPERGEPSTDGGFSGPLREFWGRLGLDPSLLLSPPGNR